jgi:hypothetical protein
MGPEIRESALRLHSEGMAAQAIAQRLGCPSRTIDSWIDREQKQRTDPTHFHKNTEPHFRYIHANNADVWTEVLRDEMRKAGFAHTGSVIEGKPARLVCGTINTHKSADNLAAIVAGKLKFNPFDGGYYAFCGHERARVRCIRWDGGGFQMMTRRRERGLYVWPPTRMGATVTVTAEEFEFILNGSSPPSFSKEIMI